MSTKEGTGQSLWAPKRNHILVLASLSVLAGCLAAPRLEAGLWLWAVAAAALLLGVLLRCLGRQAGLALALCCFAIGALRASANLTGVQPQPGRYLVGGFVQGGVRQRSDNRVSFILTRVTLDGQSVPGRAYVSLHYDKAPPKLFDGAQLAFRGRVYLPDGKAGPSHMDFRLWMGQKGLRFGIAAYQETTVLNTPENAPVQDGAYRLRCRMEEALHAVMGDSARVAMAMLFSQTDGLAEEEYQAFQTLGVAHIMSVSGLHIGLLAAMLTALWRALGLRRGPGLLLQSALLLGYCMLAGFSAAALRAVVMTTAFSLARFSGRRADRLTTLSLAMLTVLLISPLQAFSAGFALSFSAMLGILLLYRPIWERLEPRLPAAAYGGKASFGKTLLAFGARLLRGGAKTLAVSHAAQMGVLLPTAAIFHHLPLYGLAANVVLAPLAGSVLIPLYGLLLPASLVPGLGPLLGAVAAGLTEGFVSLVQRLAQLPYASLRVASPGITLCIGALLTTLALCRRVPGSRKALAAVLCAALALGGAWMGRAPSLRYIQLSVGQADAALLLDGNQTVLIDTGRDGRAVLDVLLAEGRNVDALFLTHLHMDHVGGVAALLDEGISVGQVYLPANAENGAADPNALHLLDRLRAVGISVSTLARGAELRYNESVVRVLWPDSRDRRVTGDANDKPLVLAVEFGGYTLLCASDLTSRYECYAAVEADVLKAAHHGSAESTSAAFLETVRPRAALVSCSSGSRYLPSDETLDRLARQGVFTLRTDESGDITLTVENGRLMITPYQERNLP